MHMFGTYQDAIEIVMRVLDKAISDGAPEGEIAQLCKVMRLLNQAYEHDCAEFEKAAGITLAPISVVVNNSKLN